MKTSVTQGIRVTVGARFSEGQSDPAAHRFLFSYRIRIENTSGTSVQLLRRHWLIQDSLGLPREVEGAGVVGEQPVLDAGGTFTYTSFCDLKSDIGRMTGSYLMRRADGTTFRVRIPEFLLQVPHRAN